MWQGPLYQVDHTISVFAGKTHRLTGKLIWQSYCRKDTRNFRLTRGRKNISGDKTIYHKVWWALNQTQLCRKCNSFDRKVRCCSHRAADKRIIGRKIFAGKVQKHKAIRVLRWGGRVDLSTKAFSDILFSSWRDFARLPVAFALRNGGFFVLPHDDIMYRQCLLMLTVTSVHKGGRKTELCYVTTALEGISSSFLQVRNVH